MQPQRTLALVREVSPRLADCELMEQARVPISVARAQQQHRAYCELLGSLGAQVRFLPALPDHADGVFVEDTAVVVAELAVATRPGVASRQGEVESTASALRAWRRIERIVAPATLDGGDVLRIGRRLWVGLSRRSNPAGVAQLGAALAPYGYAVQGLELRDCLHLKSAVTFLPPDRVLVNPAWIDPASFADLGVIEVDPREPAAANTLSVGGVTLVSARHPRTAERLGAQGIRVRCVDVDELHKAEAGLTCMSILLELPAAAG